MPSACLPGGAERTKAAESALSARLTSGRTSPRSGSRIRKRPLTVAVRPGAGASVVVAASVDVAAGGVLRVGGALSWSRGRRARRRLAEDDAPVAAAVRVAAKGLPAQCAGPLDERRQCGGHDAGEGPALLGFGEGDSTGLLFGGRGPERAVVVAALGGGPRLSVGAAVQDPQGCPRSGVDRVVVIEPAEQAAQRAARERGKGLRKRVSEPVGIEGEGRGRRLRAGRGDVRRGPGRLQVRGGVDAVAGRWCVGSGTRSSGPSRRPCGCHGRRLGARLMTIGLPALAATCRSASATNCSSDGEYGANSVG